MSQVSGNKVNLLRTDPAHFHSNVHSNVHSDQSESNKSVSFNDMVIDALNGVNDLAQESTDITQQYIINPDSVDVHDVTIAMSKANLAITMTKSVVDNALKAYREIINIR
ncbi:MAG: flagellar hook-basal body complex protein FliE [Spirochaetaceae bacterium]|nr:flagellar hook-basal body complex protein FliE [Spirochaetaceae bacterium]